MRRGQRLYSKPELLAALAVEAERYWRRHHRKPPLKAMSIEVPYAYSKLRRAIEEYGIDFDEISREARARVERGHSGALGGTFAA